MVCADPTTLVVYDALNGKKTKTLFNKVHGIGNVKFTHSNDAVICTTTKEPCKYFADSRSGLLLVYPRQ